MERDANNLVNKIRKRVEEETREGYENARKTLGHAKGTFWLMGHRSAPKLIRAALNRCESNKNWKESVQN